MDGPRPLSSVMLFANDHRAQVIASLGTNHVAEVGRELGRRWKALTAEERKNYEERAVADKARYAARLAAFWGQGDF